MAFTESQHLIKLEKILEPKGSSKLFLCIKDLVENGLSLSRFSIGERKPSRQDVTQFLLTWFKYIGVTAEECHDWMLAYCLDVLSILSSSSLSQIRHSTKSNIKYIYRAEVAFDCRCENNIFKAFCDRNCPLYPEMLEKYKARIEREANKTYEIVHRTDERELQTEFIPKKERYKEQFENAMKVARDYVNQGLSLKDIATHLNKQDFKTRTGRKWTYQILQKELLRQG